jgi:CheY-like chemotaxis protein
MKLPVYAHPTLTVLVSGASSPLQGWAAGMAPQRSLKTFQNAHQALEWLLQCPPHAGVPLHVNYDLPSCSVTVDVENIVTISRQRERFATPSVLVVDFYLPGMNGLDVCRALQHLPCKKILLAGENEERIAIDALNSGLIDRYVRKQDSAAPAQLAGQIAALQRSWFLEQERTAGELLALHDFSFLRSPRMAEEVQRLYREQDFIEHYVFPQPGGLLLIDQAGRQQLMVVETEAGMQTHYEVARDSGAPRPLLEALADRRVLPLFSHAGRDSMYDREVGGEWQRYCRAPRVCHDRDTYYWALFDLPPSFLREQPYTHAQYLRDAA